MMLDDHGSGTVGGIGGPVGELLETNQRILLQFKDNMLKYVTRPGAFTQALQKSATLTNATAMLYDARQPGRQAFIQAGDFIRWKFFQRTNIQHCFNDRAVSPDIRATQVRCAENADVFLVCCHVYKLL